MRKLILVTIVGFAISATGFAQGTLNFASAAAGSVWRTTNQYGQLASGAAYMADLYYGAAGSTEAQLTALNLPATYNTGAQAGFFTGGPRTIPGFAGGTTIRAQVRVWSGGSSYGDPANTEVGKTILFNITLATPPATPVNMTGLNGQNLSITPLPFPEPTGFSLAALGLVMAHIVRRRRKL